MIENIQYIDSGSINVLISPHFRGSGSLFGTSSFAITSSYSELPLIIDVTTVSASTFYGPLTGNASTATTSNTASYINPINIGNNYSASVSTLFASKQDDLITGSTYPITSSWAITSSYARSASNADYLEGQHGNYYLTASNFANNYSSSISTQIGNKQNTLTNQLYVLTSSLALSASYIDSIHYTTSPSNGLLIGDSTITTYAGQNAIDTYLLTQSDTFLGTTIHNQAVSGHTINNQKTVWDADANKLTYDWIIVEVGINDCNPAVSSSVTIPVYQAFINDINSTKKPSATVIVSTMTPCREYLYSLYAGSGSLAYQKWLDMNTAMMGGGPIPITGITYRVDSHTNYLNDGNGYLLPFADTGDGVHETNIARQVIASAWRNALNNIGYLINQPSEFLTNYIGSGGTNNYVPKWNNNTLTITSSIVDNGNNVIIGDVTGVGLGTLVIGRVGTSNSESVSMSFCAGTNPQQSYIAASKIVSGNSDVNLASWSTTYLKFLTHIGNLSAVSDTMTLTNGRVAIGSLNNPTNSLDIIGNLSCSVITASLFTGTSSYASNANTLEGQHGNYYLTASNFANNYSSSISTQIGNKQNTLINQLYVLTSSLALSASYYPSQTLQTTVASASWVSASVKITTADTASYITPSNIASNYSSSVSTQIGTKQNTLTNTLYVLTASLATSASYYPPQTTLTSVASASWVSASVKITTADTASYILPINIANNYSASVSTQLSGKQLTLTGTNNYVPLWNNNNLTLTSSIYQSSQSSSFIGINTTTPCAQLDVSGSTVYSNGLFNHYQNLAAYNIVFNETGTIKISLPYGYDATQLVIKIQGYNMGYGGASPFNGGAWEVVVSGYNPLAGWSNALGEIRGKAPFTSIRLGFDGTHTVILLGTLSTAWNGTNICISDIYVGYGDLSGWGSGWTISRITSEAGISGILSLTTPTYINNNNQLVATSGFSGQLTGSVNGNINGIFTGYLIGTSDSSSYPWNVDINNNIINMVGKVGINSVAPVNLLDVVGNISCSVITASLFGTASYAMNGGGGSLITGNTYPITSSWAVTASFAISASTANAVTFNTLKTTDTARFQAVTCNTVTATTFAGNLNGNVAGNVTGNVTGSLYGTASYAKSASYSINAGNAISCVDASTAEFAYGVDAINISNNYSQSVAAQINSKQPSLITGNTYLITASWAANGTGGGTISGTTNYIPKYNAAGNGLTATSSIFDNNTTVTISKPLTVDNINSSGTMLVNYSNGNAVELFGNYSGNGYMTVNGILILGNGAYDTSPASVRTLGVIAGTSQGNNSIFDVANNAANQHHLMVWSDGGVGINTVNITSSINKLRVEGNISCSYMTGSITGYSANGAKAFLNYTSALSGGFATNASYNLTATKVVAGTIYCIFINPLPNPYYAISGEAMAGTYPCIMGFTNKTINGFTASIYSTSNLAVKEDVSIGSLSVIRV